MEKINDFIDDLWLHYDRKIEYNAILDIFTSGIYFAEEWLPIERDIDGFTTDEQDRIIMSNCPFLAKDNDSVVVLFKELYMDVHSDQRYKFWRPLKRR